MGAVQLASLILKVAAALIGWARERQLIGEAEDALLGRQAQAILTDIGKAQAARDAVRDKLKSNPGWMPGDDPNKRD